MPGIYNSMSLFLKIVEIPFASLKKIFLTFFLIIHIHMLLDCSPSVTPDNNFGFELYLSLFPSVLHKLFLIVLSHVFSTRNIVTSFLHKLILILKVLLLDITSYLFSPFRNAFQYAIKFCHLPKLCELPLQFLKHIYNENI